MDLEEHCIVSDIIQSFHHVKWHEFLGPKAGVSLSDGSPQERFVVLAGVRFDRVGYVAAS